MHTVLFEKWNFSIEKRGTEGEYRASKPDAYDISNLDRLGKSTPEIVRLVSFLFYFFTYRYLFFGSTINKLFRVYNQL